MSLSPRPLAILLLATSPAVALACSCEPPRDAVSNAEIYPAVFTARVLSVRVVKHDNSWLQRTRRRLFDADPPRDGYLDDELEVEYTPQEVFKGTTRTERRLVTLGGESMCGYPRFEVGKDFLVFAWRTKAQALTTGLCSGTKPLNEAASSAEALRKHFGTTGTR